MQRAGWICVLGVLALTVAAALRQSPDVTTDAGTCLLSAEQYRLGRTPVFHSLIEVDPRDLTRDRQVPVTWWPASYEALPYTLRWLGLTWGQAVQGTFLLGWTVGLLGWAAYFRWILRPGPFVGLFLAFLLFRSTHSNANIYDGGEFLFWCVFPAVLLLNLSAATPREPWVWGVMPSGRSAGVSPAPRAAETAALPGTAITTQGWRVPALTVAAGLAASGLVVVKYSAGLCLPGMGAAWWWLAARKKVSFGQAMLWSAAAAAGALLVLGSGLVGGSNPATHRSAWQLAPLAWGASAWTFAVSDLETLLMRVLVHRAEPLLIPVGPHGDGQMTWLGPFTLGLLLLLWAALRRTSAPSSAALRPEPSVSLAWEFVVVHLAVYTAALVGLLMAGGAIHMDARLVRPPAIALLPFLLAAFLRAVRSELRSARWMGVLALGVFLVIPAAYGASTIVYKTMVRGASAANRTGPLGLRHDLLDAEGNAVAFYDEIRRAGGPRAVYFLIDPGLALPLADARVVIDHAHFRSVAELRDRRYVGRPVGGVALVVPADFSANGKLETIQRSFVDVPAWTVRPLTSEPGWLVALGREPAEAVRP